MLAYTVGEDGAEAGETGLYLIRSARGAEPYEPTFALAEAPSEPEEEPEEEPKEKPEEEPEEAPGETLIEVGEAEEPAFDDRSEDVGGSIYETDGTLRDTEAEGIEKNETEEAAETGEDVNAGSAIGVGSMIAIAVMIFIAAVVVFLFVMFRNRKPEGQEKW